MKRILLAVFLAVFAASTIGRTIVRTAAWTAERASDFGPSKDRGSARMGEARKHSSWQLHTKILKDGSVAFNFLPELDPPRSEEALPHTAFAFVPDHSSRFSSTRAPPALI